MSDSPKKVLFIVLHSADCPVVRAAREASSSSSSSTGPAQVATDAYRSGWDAINWSGKPGVVGQA